MPNIVPHYINGSPILRKTTVEPIDIVDPKLGKKLSSLYAADAELITQAIKGAGTAFETWSKVPAVKRARVLFKFKQLLDDNLDLLAKIISQENGKTFEDAQSEVFRGIEIVEYACGIPNLLKGEYSENVGNEVDSYSIRQPIGVCLGLTPFNFPAMVPMWMFPIAIACGNTFILKPSEKVPSAALKLAELFTQAGLPDGVLQILQGGKETADLLMQHQDLKAISFVGSTKVAKYVYASSAATGKRVQALGGAKNHCVVMPDANLELAINGIKGAAFGAAGQRCMSLSVVIVVGSKFADGFVNKLQQAIRTISAKDTGPIQNLAHKDQILAMIEKGLKSGAKLIVDGRQDAKQNQAASSFYLEPSLFDYVRPEMEIYQEEIFGPVLCVLRLETLDQALDLIDLHNYGNGASIYTQDGAIARKFSSQVQAGMVGVNVPIPVPMAFHSFGGWKQSLFGSAAMYGQEGVNFYTKLKTVTCRWPDLGSASEKFSMPVST